jgi:diacylglycerol O-acyltransferase-1
LLVCFSVAFIAAALLIEQALRPEHRLGIVATELLECLWTINLIAVLAFPASIILVVHGNPFGSALVLGIYSCIFLKLISYKQVNAWCRRAMERRLITAMREQGGHGSDQSGNVACRTDDTNNNKFFKRHLVTYPYNITASNMAYFMLAPTLCYELNFPRSPRIRRWFLAKRLIEIVLFSTLAIGLSEQWILPLLNNAVKPLIAMELGRVLERFLKLAVPNHIIWLMCFYLIFHSGLNAVAEVLCFADRQFYRDWWNAETISYFWQAWNIPVHRWAVRHLYRPLLRSGYTKMQAAIVVFVVSAFFHEYLISIPLSMFRLWAFMGMLAQVPLGYLTGRILKGKYGNMVVWFSLILGQPLCILMYLHDYYVRHYNNSDVIHVVSFGSEVRTSAF